MSKLLPEFNCADHCGSVHDILRINLAQQWIRRYWSRVYSRPSYSLPTVIEADKQSVSKKSSSLNAVSFCNVNGTLLYTQYVVNWQARASADTVLDYVRLSLLFFILSFLCRYTRATPHSYILTFRIWQFGKRRRAKPSSQTPSHRKHTKPHLDMFLHLRYCTVIQATGTYPLSYDTSVFPLSLCVP